ncbi:RNA-binding domain-containing protein [Cryphonectria parasitica EP155]|uniref:RNA-binding domain-containing protein n=1 Tax=Cryphonectria parasitica (strain ATCC 38755 / EP155) TaxID=660469 RepID=A0A9P4Y8F0_CRYP1|nr:RNA-binding domain-containing protein [Cryphonectria parasitica EP155]KAF3768879.1 RNA-binding domain-containing protein [Cryphonectria parasitica EP155]
MNKIRAIQELNKKEIEQGISPNASWHVDYRDTAFIYFGGLPYELSEGDIITIFSQYGEPVFLKLARDRETGKSRGFGWLKYEDQRSTDLAVDNLGGATIGGRMVSVDHTRYKMRDDEDWEEGKIGWEDIQRREKEAREDAKASDTEMGSGTDTEEEIRRARPMLKEERELQLLIEGHDDDDPMKEFLIEEKKKEVDEALRRERKREEREKKHKSRLMKMRRKGVGRGEGEPKMMDAERGQEGMSTTRIVTVRQGGGGILEIVKADGMMTDGEIGTAIQIVDDVNVSSLKTTTVANIKTPT